MEMTTAKTVAVFAIIIGCFAVLYPKIFHPMLLHAFGSAPSRGPETMVPQVPPHLRRPGQGGRGAAHGDDFAPHMRGGPHPGMRAAAEMKKQAAATQGSGKGMMSVVLPMYAVGIVIYLIYTMTKVFGGGKKNENEENKDYMQSHFKDGSQGGGGKRRLMVDDDEIRQQPAPNPQENRKRQKDLERLLMKADKDKITELEMQQLKQRLLETEAQMSRILQAMETVAEKVEGQADQQPPDVETILKGAKDRPTKLSDASPDLDSYDFVQRSSAEQSPVMVEDLRANEHDLEGIDDDTEEPIRDDIEDDDDLADSEEEDIDDIELEYDPSPDEAEPEEENEECTEEIIGQKQSEEVEKEEEQHPDLRKRQKQKQKVKRAD